MSVNKAILVGRLGRDPETRYTGGGVAVATFSLATDESFKNRNGEKQKKTEWHRCVAWNKLAEIIQQYCTKGMLIYVEGSIGTREWQDKEGVKRWSTEITVRSMKMLGGGKGGNTPPEHGDEDAPTGGYGGRAPEQAPSAATGTEISDEDIPF